MKARTVVPSLLVVGVLGLSVVWLQRPPIAGASRQGVVRLPSTASIWLADTTPEERNSSAGLHERFKLKSIQEMAAVRFDARAVRGRGVQSARLYLHTASDDRMRYLRVSTVSQDWAVGTGRRPYGSANGATYLWADASTERPWSLPGSEFADVVMGMGHSLTTYGELQRERDGWVSVSLTPELVYAVATERTDGLALMDGGNPTSFNNFLHSATADAFAPYIEVDVAGTLSSSPAAPQVTAVPAPAKAHMTTGAIDISIEPETGVLSWHVEIDGAPVPRWRVPFPPAVARTGREQTQLATGRAPHIGPVAFTLDTLTPAASHTLSVTAIAPSGARSQPTQVVVAASAALPDAVRIALSPPLAPNAAPVQGGDRFTVWPVPGLVKIGPESTVDLFRDMSSDGGRSGPNAVWDGQTIQLFGARGEYVSYQLVIDRTNTAQTLTGIRVVPTALTGPGGAIAGRDIELHKNWYARNSDGVWQPAYTVPWEPARSFEIPDRQRSLTRQTNQSIYVDVFIPKTMAAGTYRGTVVVESGRDAATLPVVLQVFDFALPDALTFWPELNSYTVPANALDYHRLAHQHRLVFNPWVVQPGRSGSGKTLELQWEAYDAAAGPLLSGEAFRGNRRAGVPTPVMYLPFIDSWPTPLSRDTYRYTGQWPGRGEPRAALVDHYLTAPYIGDGLTQEYTDAFLAAQREFVEHFAQKGWSRTEMQLFFGGKVTHRVDFGSNMWWTTDEPYFWNDWVALQFFCNLWAQGRRSLGASPTVWAARADLSRPMWTGRVLDGVVDAVYWGGFTNDRWYRRAAWLAEHTGARTRVYGAASPSTVSNTASVSVLVHAWLHGAQAFLPWQTLGDDASLDTNDNVEQTLLVPGTRFGVPVVGDMRLKALRDGQQLIEYLEILENRYGLQREQVRVALERALPMSADRRAGASADNAGGTRTTAIPVWQLAALRRAVAELIVTRGEKPKPAGD